MLHLSPRFFSSDNPLPSLAFSPLLFPMICLVFALDAPPVDLPFGVLHQTRHWPWPHIAFTEVDGVFIEPPADVSCCCRRIPQLYAQLITMHILN